jgi:UDP-N-acetylmuramoyl-L-alanyl-D-glutamate--2,6-diaminopimelate ligase
MRLPELLQDIENIKVFNIKDVEIKGITDVSGKVKENYLFGAFKGEKTDGLKYLNNAIHNGAITILSHTPPPNNINLPWIDSDNERKTFAIMAKRLAGNIDRILKIIGITGTNGKTSITYILESLLNYFGIKTGVMGSINYRWGTEKIKSKLTTPQASEIFELMLKMASAEVKTVIMEVSSHAINTERVSSIDFDYGIFTNLSGDHFDYHKTFENYFNVKKRLFEMIDKRGGKSFINMDDDYGRRIMELFDKSCVSYGIINEAEIRAENYEMDRRGLRAEIKTYKGVINLKTNLLGLPNLYNILSSVGVLLDYGFKPEEIEEGFEKTRIKIPGRLDRIDNPYTNVFIDYAHSDDSLKNVILALKQMNFSRVITVFGAGGDRDRTKRPRMGEVATELSDFVIITSDNPRTEDPEMIISDILQGTVKNNYIVVEDRKRAIREAVSMARRNDVILIAGKGHEDYQILGEKIIRFSDYEEVEKSLKEIKGEW